MAIDEIEIVKKNEINELITNWEEEEALYNVRHPDYSINQML